MKCELKYKRYGEQAILIEWPSEIDEILLQDLLFYKKLIENHYGKLIIEVISSYSSLLIYYRLTIEDVYDEILILKSLYQDPVVDQDITNRLWKIPVCYSPLYAPDLQVLADAKSITIEELIALHTAPIYTVYFLGFLPGFLYLGGLSEKLVTPRKASPSLEVKKGAVAIGGNQTGIYPTDSPGGWHVIGSTPITFFDVSLKEPSFVSPDDRVQFISINENKYNDISLLVDTAVYIPESIDL